MEQSIEGRRFKKFIKAGLAGFVGLLLFFLSACDLFNLFKKPTGSLDITVLLAQIEEENTLVPVLQGKVANYYVSFSGAEYKAPVTLPAGSTTLTQEGLEPGVWEVSVTGKNSGGAVIVSGSGIATLTKGVVLPLSITVNPSQIAMGGMDVTFDWTSSGISEIDTVTGSLTREGGNPSQVVFTILGGAQAVKASYSLASGLTSGSYTLSAVFNNNGSNREYGSKTLLLNVFDNLITQGMIILTSEDLTPPPVYSVTFDSQGGPEVASVEVTEGMVLEEPEDPVWEDFFFAGWYRDPEGNDAWDFAADTVTESLTLYAKWIATVDLAFVILVSDPLDENISFNEDDNLEIYRGGLLALSVPPSFDLYFWYLDGDLIPGAETESVNVDTEELGYGIHRVSLYAVLNGRSYSKSFVFTVIN